MTMGRALTAHGTPGTDGRPRLISSEVEKTILEKTSTDASQGNPWSVGKLTREVYLVFRSINLF